MPRAHAGSPRTVLALAIAALATWGAGVATAQQSIDGCQIFPTSNVWNTPVVDLPLHASSNTFIATLGSFAIHGYFGKVSDDPVYGIPYDSVPDDQALVPIDYSILGFPVDSDAGPFPIPLDPSIEGEPNHADGDRHILVLRQGTCRLYELWYAYPDGATAQALNDNYPNSYPCTAGTNGWCAGLGATWDLTSDALRPDGKPSADPGGLPILPGLARAEEAGAGEIRHALRFTASPTRAAHIWPARSHGSGSSSTSYPPIGVRLRLKAAFDISGFSAQTRRILTALKRYGMILAETGPNWYISGIPSDAWSDAVFSDLQSVHGSDFEVVDESSLMIDPDSGATPHIFSDGFENDVTPLANWSSHTP